MDLTSSVFIIIGVGTLVVSVIQTLLQRTSICNQINTEVKREVVAQVDPPTPMTIAPPSTGCAPSYAVSIGLAWMPWKAMWPPCSRISKIPMSMSPMPSSTTSRPSWPMSIPSSPPPSRSCAARAEIAAAGGRIMAQVANYAGDITTLQNNVADLRDTMEAATVRTVLLVLADQMRRAAYARGTA
ncbi:MAG: hypothetical protein H0X24_00180 [Ktedonobacterales bacterium]|nr:hypothetical protein [Ktedonobacterales bacterium]